jgi:hypothetical protein
MVVLTTLDLTHRTVFSSALSERPYVFDKLDPNLGSCRTVAHQHTRRLHVSRREAKHCVVN